MNSPQSAASPHTNHTTFRITIMFLDRSTDRPRPNSAVAARVRPNLCRRHAPPLSIMHACACVRAWVGSTTRTRTPNLLTRQLFLRQARFLCMYFLVLRLGHDHPEFYAKTKKRRKKNITKIHTTLAEESAVGPVNAALGLPPHFVVYMYINQSTQREPSLQSSERTRGPPPPHANRGGGRLLK